MNWLNVLWLLLAMLFCFGLGCVVCITSTGLIKIRKVLRLIVQYGGIGGAHHKEWVIDQIVRILTGPKYDKWVEDYSDGEKYIWDEGIAP